MDNYQNAARSAGGKVLYDSPEATTFRVSKGGKQMWVSISVGNLPSGVPIMMSIIEKQAMEQEVTFDAKAMAYDIGEARRLPSTAFCSIPGNQR